MRHWSGMLIAIGMTSFANAANAQDCEAIQAGPARTDCYIGLSRISQGKSNIAAGAARTQSDAARYRQVTGSAARKRRPPTR